MKTINEMFLDQILESGAKDRLARLALVKKEKARSVEDSLIQAAQNGRLPGKVSEAQLIVMLEQLSGHEEEGLGNIPRKSKVVIQRRKYSFDDDNDNDDSDLL
jgi:programmed cell death protein 5